MLAYLSVVPSAPGSISVAGFYPTLERERDWPISGICIGFCDLQRSYEPSPLDLPFSELPLQLRCVFGKRVLLKIFSNHILISIPSLGGLVTLGGKNQSIGRGFILGNHSLCSKALLACCSVLLQMSVANTSIFRDKLPPF